MAPIITNGNFSAITAFSPIAVTGEADTEVFSAVAHGLLDNQKVRLYGLTGGTGIAEGEFYVVNKNADDFQLSTTKGGSAAAFTTDITAGYVIRIDGVGIPTGWTITKAGSSEFIAGNLEADSPGKAAVNTFGILRIDGTPNTCSAHQHITLAPSTRYHLTVKAEWFNENPAVLSPDTRQAYLRLSEDGGGHDLGSDGSFSAPTVQMHLGGEEGNRESIVFTTPATHTAYTLTISEGTLSGGTVYCEGLRITELKIEPCPFDDPKQRPENNDTVRAALPENS